MSLKTLLQKFADETMKDVVDNKLTSEESTRDKYKDAISKLISSIEQDGLLSSMNAKDLKLTIKIIDNTSVVEESQWGPEDEINQIPAKDDNNAEIKIENQEKVIEPIERTVRNETPQDPNVIRPKERVIPIQQTEVTSETKPNVTLNQSHNERIVPIELTN